MISKPLKRIRTILAIVASLLMVQGMYGQQDKDAVVSPQYRIRIPRQAMETGLQGQAKKAIPALREEIFREDIGEDSVDLSIDPSELEFFRAQFPGLRVLKAAPLIDNTDMAANLAEAMTFRKYPTYDQYLSMMEYFGTNYPAICRVDTFGTSVEGRLLLALKISDNVEQEEDEPAFLYTSSMHGDELVGYVLCLRLADFLLSNYGNDVEVDRVINDVELWINPLANPDGTFYPDNDNTVQASVRNNVNDVNLNRNFPDPAYGEADDASGREPETRYMMDFMKQIRPNLSANIHSGAEVVNYPWDHKNARHPDDDWYILISMEYADEAKAVSPGYLNLYASGITNGADWYIINGGRQDYVNYYLHGREVTLELSNIKRLESEYLDDHWNFNKWSMINLVTQSRYGIHGNVTDHTGSPVGARIWVLDHDNDSSWVESDPVSGNFYRYLKEGVYDLVITSDGFLADTIFGVEVYDYQQTVVSVLLDSLVNGSGDRNGNKAPEGTGSAVDLKVFPNPASDLLHIKTTAPFSNETWITITDLSGRMLVRTRPPAGISVFVIDLSSLESGTYLLRRSGDNHPASEIIIARD